MKDHQDLESPLDELFKKTFDSLPTQPSQTGWDLPSPEVWEHVQARLKQPRTGLSNTAIALIASLAVVITIGLYFRLNHPATQPAEKPAFTLPVETPPTAPPTPAMATTASEANPSPLPTQSRRKAAHKTETPREIPSSQPSSIQTPPPNSLELQNQGNIKPRNSRERLWHTPLEPLPRRTPVLDDSNHPH